MATRTPTKRPTGQERTAHHEEEPEKRDTARPSSESAHVTPEGRAKVSQPTRGAAQVPAREEQRNTAEASGGDADTGAKDADSDKGGGDKKGSAEVTEATLTKDVTNINRNIEHNDQDLMTQIKDLQGRAATLEQDDAALTASVDELQGNANYTSTGGGGGLLGGSGLFGFSTTTWLIIVAVVGVGGFLWYRSRHPTEPVMGPEPAPAGPPGGGPYG